MTVAIIMRYYRPIGLLVFLQSIEREPFMAIIHQAYFDESGKKGDHPVVTFSGVAVSSKQGIGKRHRGRVFRLALTWLRVRQRVEGLAGFEPATCGLGNQGAVLTGFENF